MSADRRLKNRDGSDSLQLSAHQYIRIWQGWQDWQDEVTS